MGQPWPAWTEVLKRARADVARSCGIVQVSDQLNDITTTSPKMMVQEGNHHKLSLFQLGEVLQLSQNKG